MWMSWKTYNDKIIEVIREVVRLLNQKHIELAKENDNLRMERDELIKKVKELGGKPNNDT